MVERDLLGVDLATVASAEVLVGGQPLGERRIHSGRHDKENSFWALPGSPEARDTVFGGFLEKVLQLRASTYPSDAEAPATGATDEVLTLVLHGDQGELARMTVARSRDLAQSKDGELVWSYFARSTRTRERWAAVSKTAAGEIADQLGQLAN